MPDTAATGLGSLSPIGVGLGALQTGIGIVNGIADKKKRNQLLGQLQPYKTPQQVYDVLNATENNASQGYDPTTLNYLNNQTDQAFSGSIDAATKLGADPNTLSSIFGQKVDAIMKIGAENHQLNTANFSNYINALSTVGASKAAEEKSKQDIIRNKLQAANANLGTDSTNISGGLNTILSTLVAGNNPYKDKSQTNNDTSILGINTPTVGNIAMGNLANTNLTGGTLAGNLPVDANGNIVTNYNSYN